MPGLAHFFTFWAFIILGLTIVEAFGAMFDRDFAIPVIGALAGPRVPQDFIALGRARRARRLHA